MYPFDFWKFMQGFFPVSGEKAGKLLWFIVMFTLCLFVYNKYFATKQVTTISGERVTVNQGTNVKTFGLKVGKVGLGLWYE